MQSKCRVVGLTLRDGDDTNSFLQEDSFPGFTVLILLQIKFEMRITYCLVKYLVS